jgi:hypothetical protein
MDSTFSTLEEKYLAFVYQQEEVEDKEKLDKARALLGQIREAGTIIYRPEHRMLLSTFARNLGEIVYNIIQLYPPVWLEQYIEPLSHIPFANREDELKVLLSPLAPAYYLIDAPAGYGKTKVLKELEEHFQKQNWLSVYINMDEDETLNDLARQLAFKLKVNDKLAKNPKIPISARFAGALKAHWQETSAKERAKEGLVLLIDLEESYPASLFRELLRYFIPVIEKSLHTLTFFKTQHNRFRVIFTGRYLASEEAKKLLGFKIIRLTPFDEQEVQNLTREYLPDDDENSVLQLSAHLFYLTGGHPGCAVQILETYQEEGLPLELFIEYSNQTIWQDIVREVAETIYNEPQSPPQIQSLFERLAIFRYVDYSILKMMLKGQEMNRIRDAYDLGDVLTGTHLFDWEGRFLQNHITRRLLVIYLRNQKAKQFSEQCQQASRMCLKRLEQAQVQNPEKWVIEYLFQSLQQDAPLIGEAEHRAKIHRLFFEQYLPKALQVFVSARNILPETSREEQKALKQAIQEDGEFCFTVNYYLRQNQYNESPCNLLQEQINNFFTLYQQTGR